MKTYKKKDLIEDGKSLHIFWETRTDRSEPTHTHDFIELVYVKEGSAREWVDGQEYQVKRGDFLFLNYDCTHSFFPNKKYTYINICFSPETVGNTIITSENAFSLLTLTAFDEMRSESSGGKLSFFGGERKEIEDILDAMLREYAEKADLLERCDGKLSEYSHHQDAAAHGGGNPKGRTWRDVAEAFGIH